ncbi:RasGTPase-activating protein [Pelomyxa schiedti]|nr:RasGTPase-activating protein [Pelomyxa schiedti]
MSSKGRHSHNSSHGSSSSSSTSSRNSTGAPSPSPAPAAPSNTVVTTASSRQLPPPPPLTLPPSLPSQSSSSSSSSSSSAAVSAAATTTGGGGGTGTGTGAHDRGSASASASASASVSGATGGTGTGTGGSVSLLTVIQNQDPVALSKLVQLLKELNDLKRKISISSKKNFQLEGDINVLDEKIARLIKHRTTLDEVLKAKGEMATQQLNKSVSFKTTQEAEAYGRLFWLLQRKTQYISKLARLIKLGEIDNFLQTVMFTLFGNQYEEEEEHLLLSMFQCVLQAEFAEATSIVNILRSNTALTRMLNTYTRRGPGQQYLKVTLTSILAKTVADPNLNLEINPAKVFEAYVNDYESKEGKTFTEERKLTTEQAAAHPKVQEIIAPRMAQLERIADEFVAQLVNSLDAVPYGIRWISRQISDLFHEKFPEASQAQKCSVIGGFFLLRFVNPAIVTPNAFMLIDTKLSQTTRRNLTLIAKMLQNIANNVPFGGVKEFYMEQLNPMLERNTPIMNQFMERLTEVEDLSDHLSMDKYLSLGKAQDTTITISLNEIYFIHSLLALHCEAIAPDSNDEMRQLLRNLSAPPPQLPRKDNANVELKLLPPKDGGQTQMRPEQLYSEIKFLLFSLIRSVPTNLTLVDGDVRSLLAQIAKWATSQNTKEVLEHIGRILVTCKKLTSIGGEPDTVFFARMSKELAEEFLNSNQRIVKVAADIEKLKVVHQALLEHNEFGNQQLRAYEEYLNNARNPLGTGPARGDKTKVKHISGPFKFTHNQLMKDGVIIESDVPDDRRAHVCFEFSSPTPGMFDIKVSYRSKGISELKLQIDDLLERQSSNHLQYETDFLILNVNLVIYLLNKHFFS